MLRDPKMFNIPDDEIGVKISNLVVYSIPFTIVTLFFTSYAYEILGRKWTLFFSFFLTSLLYYLIPLTSPNYNLLMLVRCLLAITMAAPIAHPLIADYVHINSRGKMIAFSGMGIVVGEIIAISIFKYRDGFYRVFSQTNFALANTLASQQPKGSSPNQTTQQNITTLIQQSIDAARAAVTVAPQTYLNWQNLSSIYRRLIGFGQNAENFAIATAQQSINLDPNNPQEYIFLGGIYYQLGRWDNAQSQFQIAIALKPDYANAHYNLGHALEQKGDLQNALGQYQAVRSLVSNDKNSLEQVDKEIATLQGKAQTQAQAQAEANPTNNANQTLKVNKPEAQLPAQNPPVKIPAPPIATPSSK